MTLINKVQFWATEEWPANWRVWFFWFVSQAVVADVNSGISLTPVLCSFQRALRIKTKSGVPGAGWELVSKEEYWPLYIVCVLHFIETVISVAPYYSGARQTETPWLWNTFIQIRGFMKKQLKGDPGTGGSQRSRRDACYLGARYGSGCLVGGRPLHSAAEFKRSR